MEFIIAKSKIKNKNYQSYVENPITWDEWFEIVNSDESLIWFDNTDMGIDFYSSEFGQNKPKFIHSIYLYDAKKGCGIMDINIMLTLPVIKCEILSQRKECMSKLFEIADKLNAKVFKLGKEIERK